MNVILDDLVDGLVHQVQNKVLPNLESLTKKASSSIIEYLDQPPSSTDFVYLTDRLIVCSQPKPSYQPTFLDPGRDPSSSLTFKQQHRQQRQVNIEEEEGEEEEVQEDQILATKSTDSVFDRLYRNEKRKEKLWTDSFEITDDESLQKEENEEPTIDDDDENDLDLPITKTPLGTTINNSPATMASYLEKRHGKHRFLVFSLQDESPDDRTLLLFNRQIVQLGWKNPCPERSENPTIPHLLKICYAIHSYLSLNEKNVAVVYCRNGKTRTAIAVACYLRFAGLVKQSYQGFLHFLKSKKLPQTTWHQLPPSLHLFFRQFDTSLESGGCYHDEPLLLRAITLQGIPVEDKPCLDIWDSSPQRHVYSSHPQRWSSTSPSSGESRWSDEEGFYKINTLIQGDFVILCRFGGGHRDESLHDPSKILWRYANTTGFCSGGLPYELPSKKVDLMRRYAPQMDHDDFLVTLLFQAEWERTSMSSRKGENKRDRIWPAYSPQACEEGLHIIFQCHSARPDKSDIQEFLLANSDLTQQQQPCPPNLVCLALQLTNFQYSLARYLLLENKNFSWWTSSPDYIPREETNDDDAIQTKQKAQQTKDEENIQQIFSLLDDEVNDIITNSLDPLDIQQFQAYTASAAKRPMRNQIVADKSQDEQTPERRNTGLSSFSREQEQTDLCLNDSGWMLPGSLAYPRPGDIAQKFGLPSPTISKTLESRRLPRVPYFDYKRPVLHSSKRQRTSDNISILSPQNKNTVIATPLFLQLQHTGVTLEGLTDLLQASQQWSSIPPERLPEEDLPRKEGQGEQQSVSKETSMNQEAKKQKEIKWLEARKVEGGSKKSQKEEDAKKKEAQNDGDDEVPLKKDPLYAKFFKMLQVGMLKKQVIHAMTRDGKDPHILDLDPNKSLESQIPKQSGEIPLKDDPEYAKYFKMLKMGLPKDAVKNSLTRDGKDLAIVDLDPNKSVASQLKSNTGDYGPPLKEDPEFTKYFKMLSMGLPVDAVKNALARDGKDPSIIDLDPNKCIKSQTAKKVEDTGPPLKEDPEYNKYFKMLSMGLPKDAVKNALARDGKDPSIMDLDPNKSVKSQIDGSGGQAEMDTGVPLKEDPDFAKYFKMLAMGLSIDAVRNALTRDGKDPSVMDLDPSKSVAFQQKASTKKKSPGKKKKRIRRKKIYWNPINPDKLKRDSMWHIVQDVVSMKKLNYDEKEFEELFTESADGGKKKKNPKEVSAKKLVQVVDPKRSMNGGIILARLRLEYSRIADIVIKMEHNKFDSTQLIALQEYLPNDDERRGLIAYMQNSKLPKETLYADLSETEKYMYTMLDVSEAVAKFEAMLFRSVFKNRFDDINASIRTLNAACDELRSSEKFRKLMAVILTVVNQINTGGEGNMAIGFTLDALLKLNEAKAFDKKTSVLHYVVKLVKKNDEMLLTFSSDLGHIIPAENVLLDAVGTEVKTLSTDLVGVHKTVQVEAQRLEDAGELKPMTLEDLKEQRTSVRQVGSVAQFNKIDHLTGRTSMERFMVNAHYSCEQATMSIKDVKKKYIALLHYFGEDEEMPTGDFFGILRRFLSEFKKAVDQVEAIEKKAAKERKRAAARAAKAAKNEGKKKARRPVRPDLVRLRPKPGAAVVNLTGCKTKKLEKKEKTKTNLLEAIAATAASGQNAKETEDINNDKKPDRSIGGIAAMAAAAAARKQAKTPGENTLIPGLPTVEIAAMAAATAAKEKTKSPDENTVRPGLPTVGIAAMAAVKGKTKTPDENIARLESLTCGFGATSAVTKTKSHDKNNDQIDEPTKLCVERNKSPVKQSENEDMAYNYDFSVRNIEKSRQAGEIETNEAGDKAEAMNLGTSLQKKTNDITLNESGEDSAVSFEKKQVEVSSQLDQEQLNPLDRGKNIDEDRLHKLELFDSHRKGKKLTTDELEDCEAPKQVSLGRKSRELSHNDENQITVSDATVSTTVVDDKQVTMSNTKYSLIERKSEKADKTLGIAALPVDRRKGESGGREDGDASRRTSKHTAATESKEQTSSDIDEVPVFKGEESHSPKPPEKHGEAVTSDIFEALLAIDGSNTEIDSEEEFKHADIVDEENEEVFKHVDILDEENDLSKGFVEPAVEKEMERLYPTMAIFEASADLPKTTEGENANRKSESTNLSNLVSAEPNAANSNIENSSETLSKSTDLQGVTPAKDDDSSDIKRISVASLGHSISLVKEPIDDKLPSSTSESLVGNDVSTPISATEENRDQETNTSTIAEISVMSADDKIMNSESDNPKKLKLNETEDKGEEKHIDLSILTSKIQEDRASHSTDASFKSYKVSGSKSPSIAKSPFTSGSASKSPPKQLSPAVEKPTTSRPSKFLSSAKEYRRKKSRRSLNKAENESCVPERSGKVEVSVILTDKRKQPMETEDIVIMQKAKFPIDNAEGGKKEDTVPPFASNSPLSLQNGLISIVNPIGGSRLEEFLEEATQKKVQHRGPRLGDFLESNHESENSRLIDFLDDSEDNRSEMLRQNFDDSSVAQLAFQLKKEHDEAGMQESWTEGDNITNWMGWADQVIKRSDSDSVVGFELPRDLNDGVDFDDDSTIASYASNYDDISVASSFQTPQISAYISMDSSAKAQATSSFDPYFEESERIADPETSGTTVSSGITPAKVAASILFEESPGEPDSRQAQDLPLDLPTSLPLVGRDVGFDAGLSFGTGVGLDHGLSGFGGGRETSNYGDDGLGGFGGVDSFNYGDYNTLETDAQPEEKEPENKNRKSTWFSWGGGGN